MTRCARRSLRPGAARRRGRGWCRVGTVRTSARAPLGWDALYMCAWCSAYSSRALRALLTPTCALWCAGAARAKGGCGAAQRARSSTRAPRPCARRARRPRQQRGSFQEGERGRPCGCARSHVRRPGRPGGPGGAGRARRRGRLGVPLLHAAQRGRRGALRRVRPVALRQRPADARARWRPGVVRPEAPGRRPGRCMGLHVPVSTAACPPCLYMLKRCYPVWVSV